MNEVEYTEKCSQVGTSNQLMYFQTSISVCDSTVIVFRITILGKLVQSRSISFAKEKSTSLFIPTSLSEEGRKEKRQQADPDEKQEFQHRDDVSSINVGVYFFLFLVLAAFSHLHFYLPIKGGPLCLGGNISASGLDGSCFKNQFHQRSLYTRALCTLNLRLRVKIHPSQSRGVEGLKDLRS
ncbi:hypothetical protein AVEN_58322-1 [Araneus ventricosus]|uniref:Uncharacterized protein n=1 Tax=Araneus ventricosus TaxID=182803 RepID=A0A4Y2CPW8_ARAVE|nr:hypothetical protein AVEN_58322-1 [Araneus ventricosus]